VIEFIKAKSGDVTIKFEGKFLASSYDPRMEGEQWAASLGPQLVGLKTAIVLGAGVGYQLEALKKAYPHLQIIVIEKRKAILEAMRSNLHVSLLGIQILHVEATVEAFTAEMIRQGVKASYCVLRSVVSKHLDQSFYDQLQMDLNGRSAFGFKNICEIRGRGENLVTEPKLAHFSYQDVPAAKIDADFERLVAQQIIRELVV